MNVIRSSASRSIVFFIHDTEILSIAVPNISMTTDWSQNQCEMQVSQWQWWWALFGNRLYYLIHIKDLGEYENFDKTLTFLWCGTSSRGSKDGVFGVITCCALLYSTNSAGEAAGLETGLK